MSTTKKSRVFICFDFKYPYQNANSNYIRGFAQAVAENNNFEVIVIGAEQADRVDTEPSLEVYKKTKYVNMRIPVARFPFRLINHLVFGEYLCRQLDIYAPTMDDHIILYNDYPNTSRKILSKYRKLNEIGHIYSIVVEWFQPYQYKMGAINPDYFLWNQNFKRWLPRFKKIISISTYMSRHFGDLGCKCLVVPCLSDVTSQKVDIKAKKKSEKYNFTYVGSFVKKDAIPEMIHGLAQLDMEELSKMKFHFTAITERNIKEDCAISENEWKKIKNSIVFHGWMRYEELLCFYQTMDFLVLAREKNIMTLSNFPSKVPEMMSYGIVPVCSDVGDYTSLYLEDGKDSILFQGYGKNECTWAMRRALNLTPDQLTIMKHSARKKVENKLDYHKWSKELYNFIKDKGDRQ